MKRWTLHQCDVQPAYDWFDETAMELVYPGVHQPEPPPETEVGLCVVADWPLESVGGSARYAFVAPSFAPAATRELMTRVACHYLVDRIPAEGIGELSETMGRIYDFYTTMPSRAELSQAGKPTAAKIANTYNAPPVGILED